MHAFIYQGFKDTCIPDFIPMNNLKKMLKNCKVGHFGTLCKIININNEMFNYRELWCC